MHRYLGPYNQNKKSASKSDTNEHIKGFNSGEKSKRQKRNKNKIVQYSYAINKTSYNQAINTLRGDYFHA